MLPFLSASLLAVQVAPRVTPSGVQRVVLSGHTQSQNQPQSFVWHTCTNTNQSTLRLEAQQRMSATYMYPAQEHKSLGTTPTEEPRPGDTRPWVDSGPPGRGSRAPVIAMFQTTWSGVTCTCDGDVPDHLVGGTCTCDGDVEGRGVRRQCVLDAHRVVTRVALLGVVHSQRRLRLALRQLVPARTQDTGTSRFIRKSETFFFSINQISTWACKLALQR